MGTQKLGCTGLLGITKLAAVKLIATLEQHYLVVNEIAFIKILTGIQSARQNCN